MTTTAAIQAAQCFIHAVSVLTGPLPAIDADDVRVMTLVRAGSNLWSGTVDIRDTGDASMQITFLNGQLTEIIARGGSKNSPWSQQTRILDNYSSPGVLADEVTVANKTPALRRSFNTSIADLHRIENAVIRCINTQVIEPAIPLQRIPNRNPVAPQR